MDELLRKAWRLGYGVFVAAEGGSYRARLGPVPRHGPDYTPYIEGWGATEEEALADALAARTRRKER